MSQSMSRAASLGGAGWTAVAALALSLCAVPSAAQDLRADVIAAQQAEKARQLQPYQPDKAERIFVGIKDSFLEAPSGLYPYLGSVYSGGGFTVGAGYRQFTGDNTFWDLHGLYSLTSYKLMELSTASLGHAAGRVDLGARVGWRDATRVGYYGIGTRTSSGDRANYRMKQTYAGGDLKVRPGGFLVFGAGLAYEAYDLESGRGGAPSIEERYTAETAPGLGADPTFVHGQVSAGVDWRPSAGYARRGGLYELRYHKYRDRDETYTFGRVDAEVVQHLPLLRENWVISLRGLVQTTSDAGDQVPYFLLPSLGSGSTLRAFPSWRFRDRHSLLLQGEFRWIPNRLGLDMAIFYDAGKVTARRGDLDLDGLKSGVGIGVRFHGPATTPLRVELARGNEGLHLVFAGTAAF
jgi:hypothetical protein